MNDYSSTWIPTSYMCYTYNVCAPVKECHTSDSQEEFLQHHVVFPHSHLFPLPWTGGIGADTITIIVMMKIGVDQKGLKDRRVHLGHRDLRDRPDHKVLQGHQVQDQHSPMSVVRSESQTSTWSPALTLRYH